MLWSAMKWNTIKHNMNVWKSYADKEKLIKIKVWILGYRFHRKSLDECSWTLYWAFKKNISELESPIFALSIKDALDVSGDKELINGLKLIHAIILRKK